MKHILFLISCLICLSCSNKNEVKIKLEQQVYQDVFPELVKQTFEDFRKLPTIPPPPLSPNMTNKEYSKEYKDKEEIDETFRQYSLNHKIYLDSTNFAPLVVIVSDTVIGYSKMRLKRFSKYSSLKFIDTSIYKPPFKIDLSKIEMPEEYILKYKSDFRKSLEELINADWEKYPSKKQRHLHRFSGELILYQVYFNDVKDYGFFQLGFYCGKLCGCSYRIWVKKVNEKWEIDDIQNLGCA